MAVVFNVTGMINTAVFQQCTEASSYLAAEYSQEYRVVITKLLPFEFEQQRAQLHAQGKIPDQSWSVIVANETDGSAQSGESFIQMLLKTTNFMLFNLPDSDPNSYLSMAQMNYKKSLRERGNTYCWMVIKIDGVAVGRIVFELFSKQLPRTCENFLHLCRGDLGEVTDENSKEKIKLSYKGSTIFRIVSGGWFQGGDITKGHAGNSGYSCYGKTFPNESFDVKHNVPGILGMCNEGEDTNGSAFYVTLNQSSWMDRSYVAFGRVVDGLSVLQDISKVPTKHNQTPRQQIVIDDCGEVSLA